MRQSLAGLLGYALVMGILLDAVKRLPAVVEADGWLLGVASPSGAGRTPLPQGRRRPFPDGGLRAAHLEANINSVTSVCTAC